MTERDKDFDRLRLNYEELEKDKKKKLVWIGEKLINIKNVVSDEIVSLENNKKNKESPP
jgi:hypothetical protein